MKQIEADLIINEFGIATVPGKQKLIDFAKANKNRIGKVSYKLDGDTISDRQRRYMFGVVVKRLHQGFIDSGLNVSKEQVREFLKDNWLYVEKSCPITNRYVKHPLSWSRKEDALSKEVFQQKKDLIQQFAIEKLNVNIEEPDPNYKMFE